MSDACFSCNYMVHSHQEYSRGEDEFLPVHWRLTRALLTICVTYADDLRVFYACFPVWIKRSSSNQRKRLVSFPTNWVNFLWLCEIICTVSVLTPYVLAGFHDGDFICFSESCVYYCSNNLGYFDSHELQPVTKWVELWNLILFSNFSQSLTLFLQNILFLLIKLRLFTFGALRRTASP